jgi:hypothetical protein
LEPGARWRQKKPPAASTLMNSLVRTSGYEDLNDHDDLRHDPVMAVLAGKLAARRKDCAPVAGKSTLNRLEQALRGGVGRYHRIGHDEEAIARFDGGPHQVVELGATWEPSFAIKQKALAACWSGRCGSGGCVWDPASASSWWWMRSRERPSG